MTESAVERKDGVVERLEYVENNFVHHIDNECYKSYVIKKTIDKLIEAKLKIKENYTIKMTIIWRPHQNVQGNFFLFITISR